MSEPQYPALPLADGTVTIIRSRPGGKDYLVDVDGFCAEKVLDYADLCAADLRHGVDQLGQENNDLMCQRDALRRENEHLYMQLSVAHLDLSGDVYAKLSAARALINVLASDLSAAAKTFREYETLHRAKGTEDSQNKALRNALIAARMEDAAALCAGWRDTASIKSE